MVRTENQGTQTYLIYELSMTDKIDSLGLGMLNNNKIPGLASESFGQMNSKKYVKYNVTSKISLKQYLMGEVSRNDLLKLFDEILNTLIVLDDYMMNPNQILLDPDNMFIDVSSGQIFLIYLPIIKANNFSTDIVLFFKQVMFCTRFNQSENCDYVAKIINFLNDTPVFSLQAFKSLLVELEKDEYTQVKSTVFVDDRSLRKTQSSPSGNTFMPSASHTNINPDQNNQRSGAPQGSQPNLNAAVHSSLPKKPSVSAAGVSGSIQEKKSMAIPGLSAEKSESGDSISDSEASEEGISMFYLLSHYNRENHELYKRQRAQKKTKTKTPGDTSGIPKPGSTAAEKAVSHGILVPNSSSGNTPMSIELSSFQAAQSQNGASLSGHSAHEGNAAVSLSSSGVSTSNSSNAAGVHQSVVPQSVMPLNYNNGVISETTVLSSNNPALTTVLSASMLETAYLIRQKNNERIRIDKPIFKLGKERSFVDYFIADNSAISRSHAIICKKNGRYYIMDTNSTNHTYVNGVLIQSNTEIEITDGVKIRLANEEFEFKTS